MPWRKGASVMLALFFAISVGRSFSLIPASDLFGGLSHRSAQNRLSFSCFGRAANAREACFCARSFRMCGAPLLRSDPDAQVVALSAPMMPTLDLEPQSIVRQLCAGLQHNDLPSANTGLERFYNFAEFECRSALTARQGAKTLGNFTKYAAREPVFSLILYCDSFSVGKGTVMKGTATRGDMGTQRFPNPAFLLLPRSAQLNAKALQHLSWSLSIVWSASASSDNLIPFGNGNRVLRNYPRCAMLLPAVSERSPAFAVRRSGLERISVRDGFDKGALEETQFRFLMEKQRRPPQTDCWMVKECVALKEAMLFNGDAGGTVY